MTTQNIRTVCYLSSSCHQKLRDYMKEQQLTESAAIVRILQQFFEGNATKESPDLTRELETLQTTVTQLQYRLAVLEMVVAVKQPVALPRPHPPSPKQLPPQTSSSLAKRLGVSLRTLDAATKRGETFFTSWSQKRDPSQTVWQKHGELYYPKITS